MPDHRPPPLGPLRQRLLDPAAGEIERVWRVRRRRARSARARVGADLMRGASLLALGLRFWWSALRLGVRSRPRLGGIRADLTSAVRQARRRPLAWLAATLVLTLAIGSVTAISSVVHAVLLAPLPFPEPGRLVRVMELFRGRPTALSVANWRDFEERCASLDSIGVWYPTDAIADDGEPERLRAVRASASLFEAIGVAPERGRALAPAEDRSGGARVVVLGHGLWRRRFGGRADVLGRSVSIDGNRHTVVGVMPEGFGFPDGAEVWLPLALDAEDLEPGQRGAHYLRAVGRLGPEASSEGAADELRRVAAALEAAYPRSNEGYGATAVELQPFSVRDVRAGLLWLWGAVACVLLLACADVAALQLAAGAARREELAVRAALGARPGRLVRQLAVEALVLAAAGAGLGLLLAAGLLRALPAVLPAELPRAGELGLQVPVLAFALFATLLAALVFGTAPAVQALRVAAAEALGRRGHTGGRLRAHAVLVGIQAAGAALLLVGAGLSIRSLQALGAVDPGFRHEGVVGYTVALPPARYPGAADVARVTERLVARAGNLPGVTWATSVSLPPLARSSYHSTFSIEGRDRAPGTEEPRASIRAVSPGYFQTLGIPLQAGRDFGARDAFGAPGVAVLSRSLARRWWPGESPLGRRIRVHAGVARREEFREVVGVVGDVRLGDLGEAAPPAIYLPQSQYPWDVPVVLVRTAEGHRLSPASLAATAREVDPQLATWDAAPLEALVEASLAGWRFRGGLLTAFACAALLLAGVGLYALLAFVVGDRRREIGVRVALGARRTDVGLLIARGGLAPVGAGAGVGLAAAAALSPAVESALYGVAPLDPWSFAVAAGALLVTAAVSCLVPARRAACLDPAVTLRLD